MSKKNFDAPTRFSVPGSFAIHDSERFVNVPVTHVLVSGMPDGLSAKPPPVTGELATAFVPTNGHGCAEAAVAVAQAATSTASARISRFMASPPCRGKAAGNRLTTRRAPTYSRRPLALD